MSLLAVQFAEVSETDLKALVAQKVPESIVLDYKRDLVGGSDKDRYEFLADVSSFANTTGGEILFGIEEANGLPTEVVGLNTINIDQEILRIEQIVRTGSRPAISGISTRAIPLSDGKHVLLMRIPKSWNSPHQIGPHGSFRFFGRASNGKYQLDVDALRSAFRQGPELTDRMKSFRVARIAKIISNTGPTHLPLGSKIVVHLLPVHSFSSQTAIDLKAIRQDPSILTSILQAGGRTRVNLDGYLSSTYKSSEGDQGYAQLFRDGAIEIVEFVDRWEVHGRNFLPGQYFDELIQKIIKGAQTIYRALGIDAPLVAMLTLLEMQDRLMGAGQRYGYERHPPFDQREILCPDVLVDSLGAPSEAIAFPIVNLAWNAAGYEQSVFYDTNGRWIPR